jgi:hypothetical protein
MVLRDRPRFAAFPAAHKPSIRKARACLESALFIRRGFGLEGLFPAVKAGHVSLPSLN